MNYVYNVKDGFVEMSIIRPTKGKIIKCRVFLWTELVDQVIEIIRGCARNSKFGTTGCIVHRPLARLGQALNHARVERNPTTTPVFPLSHHCITATLKWMGCCYFCSQGDFDRSAGGEGGG